ncbi:RNA-directed DNA polymerase, eukaryota, reverse transcriptase zinc-binding domain protein [Tanacetum coccineum]
MGSQRTKEDDLAKISTSLFVTNFPDTCSAKDLFNSCKQYGYVVDAFIPLKRSKAGKRFGFVRFQRPPVNVNKSAPLNGGVKIYNTKANGSTNVHRNQKISGGGHTYVNVVKGSTQNGSSDNESPAMVLEDKCMLAKDPSRCLLGRVKEFASLANLKVIFNIEGFTDMKIYYMGELWVMMEFGTDKSMSLFRENVSVGSWFSQINKASLDFVPEGRIVWVELEDIDDQEEPCFHSKRICVLTKSHRIISEELKITYRGKVFWIRAKETTRWVPDFQEEVEEDDQSDVNSKDGMPNEKKTGFADDSDGEDVPETLFEEEEPIKNQSEVKSFGKHDDKSEDPFNIYSILKKKDKSAINQESESSLKHPPGFTPKKGSDGLQVNEEEARGSNCENGDKTHIDVDINVFGDNMDSRNLKEDVTGSACSGHVKKSKESYTGGSILNLLDDVVKVGQVMRYNMDGCLVQKAKKDSVKELCDKNKVNFLALQETKMETMDLLCVKQCWGNVTFDYVHSDSVGNSGGILCVWDSNAFRKSSATVSDYFIMVRGVWRQNGKNVLFIAVYAPHDVKEKIMLWDYLTSKISRWNGEVVVMGDFNEVRYSSDRFG